MRLGIDAEAMGEIRRANAAHARRMAEDSAREENSDDSDDGARASRSIASFERAFERWRKNPRSLLVFAPNSGFREGCRKVVESSAFETAIAGCIVASSVAVAVVKPKRDGTSEEMWLTIMGYVLTAVFGLEAILKIIARGFAFGEETYLSARWNQFDFFLVTVSLILLPIGGNSVMVFRLLRALHVFKIFNRYRSARLVMRTIFRALPLLGDVCLFLLWFVIFFAVSGVTVFGGRLTGRLYGTPPAQEGNASYALPTGTGKEVCAKLVAEWLGNESLGAAGTYPDAYNSTCNFASWNTNQSVEEYCCDSGVAPYDGFLDFDDAFRSAIVTLNGMTIDGWNELLNPAAYGVGFVNAFIWFIAVVIVGGFFMMELFTSVICATLQSIVDDDSQEEKEGEEEEEEEEKEKEEEEEEKEEEEEEEEKEEEGNKVKDSWNALRERCFIACKSDRFNNVVTGVIMLNTLLMMAQHANASSTFTSTSNILEYTFLAVFGMEMIFKHMAYGFIDYWRSKENALDGVIVVTGVFSSAMTSQGVSVSFLRLLRVGRAFRTFRVIRRNREFRRIISSSVLGFQDMWPFLVVWMLFSVIFAIFGFQLFSGLGTLDEERLTFKTFLRSTLTLFVISSGEDSFTVAWSTMVAYGNNFIVFYTIGWILISTVILSLVLGILIDSCALVEMEDDHAEAEERVKEKKEKLDEAVERASHIELASENALKRKVQNFTFALTALESTGALSNKSMSEDEFLGKAFSSVVPKELGGKLKNEPLKVSTSTSLAEGLKLKDNAGKIAQVNAARKRKEAMEDVGAVRLFLSSIGLKGISTDFKNVIKLSETALEEAKLRMTPKISEYQSYQDKAFGVTKSMNEEISTKMLNQYYEENSDAQETRFGMDEDEEFHGPWAARLRNQGSRKKRGPSAVVIPGVIITKDGEMIPEYDETIKIERCKSRVHRFVSHDLFENTILVLIMTSSVLLATETNTWPVAGSTTANVYENIDIGFTTVFAMECALKIFAYGLYKRPTAYLKNSFNILDAVVVLGSAFSLVIGDSGGSAVRTLRILRILRPLRSVRRFPGVRLVVNTVISSIPAVSYVCLLGLASMSIFALLGMEFFMGEFWSCRAVEDARSYTTRGACEAAGGVWRNAKFNFDNFGAALLSTFILHAGDDWQEIMWVAMDSTGYGTGYKQDNNQSAAAYFVITVLIGNFFWVNLLATALVDNFNKMASQDKLTFATPAQRRWQQAMMRAAAADLGAWRKIVPPPGNGLWSRARLAAHTVAKAKTFSFFVVGVVTANLMTALAETANMSQAEINIHYYLNTTFTIIYVLEMVILLMAQGKKRYLLTYWNWLDSFVVVVSVVDIIGQSFEVGGIMAYLKLVRLLRLLKLVNAHAGLRSLFTTFIMSIPAVANVAALSALAIFAYAIMGVSLFGDKRGPYEGGTVSNYFNFESFPTAFAALMGVYTGGWVGTFGELYQTEACLRDEPPFMSESSIDCDYNYIAIPYFISFVVVSIFLLGNLFVAIILERFSVTADQEGVYDASEVIEIIKHTIQLRRLCTSIKRKVTKAREPGGKLHGRGRDMDKDERPGSIFNKLIRRVSRRNSRSSLSGDGSPKEGKVRANRNKLSSDQREVIEMNVEVSDDEHFFSPAPSYRSKERVSPYFSLEREPEPEEEPKDEPEDAPEPAVEASTIATIFGKRVGENRFGRRASSATQSATESDDSEFEAGDEEFEAYPFERRTVRARHHPGMNTPADVLSEFAHSERSAGSRSVESYDDERSASEDDHSAYNDQSGTYTSSEEAYRFGVTGERTTPSRLNDYLYDFRDDVTQRPQAVSSLLGSDDGATLGSENESDSDDEPGASKSGVSAVLNRL